MACGALFRYNSKNILKVQTMNYKATAFILSTLIAFTGCSDSKTEQTTKVKTQTPVKSTPVTQTTTTKTVEVKKEYSLDEIYNTMCIECHSSDGSGNTEKLTPTMIGQSQEEIENSLVEIEKDIGHIIMEHNRGEILKKGMEYSAKDMAAYMHTRFKKL